MSNSFMHRLIGWLACMSLGLAALPAGASIIAEDAFNYIPLGFSLEGANGGGGSPGWTAPWSADAAAMVSTGLTYPGYGGLGLGNAVTLGAVASAAAIDPVGISRTIGDSSSASTLWMRMLYSPGLQVEESPNTATPFQLASANNGYTLNLQRTVGAGGGTGDRVYSLNMSGLTEASSLAFDFTGSGLGTYMLLFRLDINQAIGGSETLSMWLNPTAAEAGLGAPTATVSENILEFMDGNDYLALFSADGYGDKINDLVIGTTFADAIGQLNDPVTSVPEVSGPVMMAMVGILGGGVVWYRRRQKAVA